jgi:hypothetical protein
MPIPPQAAPGPGPSFGPEPIPLGPVAAAVPPRLLLQAALLMLVSTGALMAMARARVDQFSPGLTARPPRPSARPPARRPATCPHAPAARPAAEPGPGPEAGPREAPGRLLVPIAFAAPPAPAVGPAGPPAAAPDDPPAARAPEAAPESAPERVRIADEQGRVMVARVYGPPALGWVLLPDGRLARTTRLIPTDEPFVPTPRAALRDRLLAGELAGFACEESKHYLIFYQGSRGFAERSGRLLDSLYDGLMHRFGVRYKFPVHEAEFPLVAVIYAHEADFRARRPVEPDVQAYYEIDSNRIVFYERPGDGRKPEGPRALEANRLAALRQPQTVAHEGTHQILQNIGVQPRRADWPAWLVEGLAELAAAPPNPRGDWAGFSKVVPLHMATLDELGVLDPRGQPPARPRSEPVPGVTPFRELLARDALSPTDYALAWGLTHYLANERTGAFLDYLGSMSRMPPLVPRSDAQRLAEFERAFGPPPEDFEGVVRAHLGRLPYDPPTYYAVLFHQDLADGRALRATLVSPSPPIIRLWLSGRLDPNGGPWTWQAFPFPRRDAALRAAESWLGEAP